MVVRGAVARVEEARVEEARVVVARVAAAKAVAARVAARVAAVATVEEAWVAGGKGPCPVDREADWAAVARAAVARAAAVRGRSRFRHRRRSSVLDETCHPRLLPEWGRRKTTCSPYIVTATRRLTAATC